MRELERDVRPQLLVGDAVDDLAVRLDDRVRLAGSSTPSPSSVVFGVQALLVEAAQDGDALVERLAGDEARGAEPHAVAAHERCARAGCRRRRGSPCGGPRRRAPVSCARAAIRARRPRGSRAASGARSASSIQASAPGMCAASHSPCDAGTKRSSPPCTISVGRSMSPTSKPQGAANARSSSIQPSASSLQPVAADRRCIQRGERARSATARSASPSSESSTAVQPAPARRPASRSRSRSIAGRRASSPASTWSNSSMLASPMPASQSSPSAPHGATPARLAAAVRRSSQRAAHASACGPPPEMPQVAKRSSPSASAIDSTSAATAPTPGLRGASSRRSPRGRSRSAGCRSRRRDAPTVRTGDPTTACRGGRRREALRGRPAR